MSTTVHVVSFAPAGDQGGVGGFEWTYDLEPALVEYDRQVGESDECEGSHVVRLLAMTVRDGLNAEEITAVLDARLDEIEDSAPALRQHVPANTIHRPTGPTDQED